MTSLRSVENRGRNPADLLLFIIHIHTSIHAYIHTFINFQTIVIFQSILRQNSTLYNRKKDICKNIP